MFRTVVQILQVETNGIDYSALVATYSEDSAYLGILNLDLDYLGGMLIRGEFVLNGYTPSVKQKILDVFGALVTDSINATLSTNSFLLANTANGYLVLDSDFHERVVTSKEIGQYNLFNIQKDGDKLNFKCGEKLMLCTLSPQVEQRLSDYLSFQKFTQKPGIAGRVIISNSFSNELTRCKIVGRDGASLKTYIIPSYIKSIGKGGLEVINAWCELKFKAHQTIRYNSIKMQNTTIQKLEMTCDQVCSSRLSFLEGQKVKLSELCLLDVPSLEQLYLILDIIVEQGRYVNLDGYIDPKSVPDTLGNRIIKSISLKCPRRGTDYTKEIYEYSRALAKWYIQEFSQLFNDCFGQRGYVTSSEIVDCARYCVELVNKNLEVFTTIADTLQLFCKDDLTSSETHSIYQLMDTLRDRLSGIIHGYLYVERND